MPTAPTFDPNGDDTRRIAQWFEIALDGYFKDDLGRWAFRPLEQHIGICDDLADDLCAIYDSLTASAQALWRSAICDVLAFHGRDISKREAVRVLLTFAVLIRSPEVLDVLPGILSGQDDGELFDLTVEAATALASQTDASRKCLERIRTSPAFAPDYAGLILVAFCHAEPDNWLHHVKELAVPMRRLAALLSPESTALRFYARSILDAISLKRVADVNLDQLVSDSVEEIDWLFREWFQDDDSLLYLRHDDAGFRLVLRTDDSIFVELECTQHMAIAGALRMEQCPEFNEHIEALAAKHLASTTTAWQEAAAMAAAANTMLGRIDENTASTLTRVQAAWENLAAKSNATAETARQRLAEDVEQMSALLQHLATANHALESLVASAESAHGSVAKLGDETAQAASRTGEQTVAATRALEALANGARRTQATTAQALEDTAAKTAALRESLTGTAQLWQSATENFAAATGAERQRQEAIAGDARRSLDELAAGIHDVRGDVAAFGEIMKIAVSALADFAATLDRPNKRRRSWPGAWLAKAVRRRVPRSDTGALEKT